MNDLGGGDMGEHAAPTQNIVQTLSPEHAELIRRCVESLETGQRQVELAQASAEKTNAKERARRDLYVVEQKAEQAARFRINIATALLAAAGDLDLDTYLGEGSSLLAPLQGKISNALLVADMLLEEASR